MKTNNDKNHMKHIVVILIYIFVVCSGCNGVGFNKSGHTYGEKNKDIEEQLKYMLNSDLEKIGKNVDLSGSKFYFFKESIKKNGYEIKGNCDSSNGNISVFSGGHISYTYILFIHEIAHCVLRKGHDESGIKLMNSIVSYELVKIFISGSNQRLEFIDDIF